MRKGTSDGAGAGTGEKERARKMEKEPEQKKEQRGHIVEDHHWLSEQSIFDVCTEGDQQGCAGQQQWSIAVHYHHHHHQECSPSSRCSVDHLDYHLNYHDHRHSFWYTDIKTTLPYRTIITTLLVYSCTTHRRRPLGDSSHRTPCPQSSIILSSAKKSSRLICQQQLFFASWGRSERTIRCFCRNNKTVFCSCFHSCDKNVPNTLWNTVE